MKKSAALCLLLILMLASLVFPITAFAVSPSAHPATSQPNTPSTSRPAASDDSIQSDIGQQSTSVNISPDNDSEKLDVVKIITCFGVIITAALGVANLLASIRRMHVDGVSQNRIQWINSVRQITASIVCYDSRYINDESKLKLGYAELLKNAYTLSLFLNVHGCFDRVVSDYLIEFVSNQRQSVSDKESGEFIHNRRMLNFAVQVYLKSEWNRIKWENRLIRKGKYDERSEISGILSTLSGEYVNELKEKYNEYANGTKELDAPVFFERIYLHPAPICIELDSSIQESKEK